VRRVAVERRLEKLSKMAFSRFDAHRERLAPGAAKQA
jgi:hypothetical protein